MNNLMETNREIRKKREAIRNVNGKNSCATTEWKEQLLMKKMVELISVCRKCVGRSQSVGRKKSFTWDEKLMESNRH
jgi:hypothetical protein